MPIKSFTDLQIWQRSMRLAEEIYKTVKSFPKEELYGLTSQIKRAVVSIPSNIAEGFSRKYDSEFRQFLFVALGSCSEVYTQIQLAHRLRFIKDSQMQPVLDEIDEISKMIMALIKK